MRFHRRREKGVTSESYEESARVVHDDDDDATREVPTPLRLVKRRRDETTGPT